MKTLFFSVSSAILVRNFFVVPNGVLDLLKKGGIRIVLLVPKISYETIKRDFGGENVEVEAVEIAWEPNFLQRIYQFISTYLIFTEGSRLFAKYGVRLDIPVAGGKRWLYWVKLLIASTLGKSNWIKNFLMPKVDSFVYPERPYKQLFEKYKPSLIFLPNIHCTLDVAIIREARRQGVKTIGMPGSWDHFPKRFEPLRVDKLMVWNEPIKEEAIELQGYKEQDVFITGAPYFDAFAKNELLVSRDAFFEKFGLDKNKKLIFFGSEEKYSPDDGDIVDIILKAIKNGELESSTQIFLRPYPASDYDHKKFDVFSGDKNIYIDWIQKNKSFYDFWYPTLDSIKHFINILYHSDIIINTYSSIGVEASIFSKPIININFDGRKNKPFQTSIKRFKHLSHYKHVLSTDGVVLVNNKEELTKAINNFLKNPKSNAENVEKLRQKMCWKTDGKASERIAKKVLEYI